MIKTDKVLEERRFLAEFLVEYNDGNKKLAKMDYDFFQRCLNLQKSKTLAIGLSKRKRGYRDYLKDLENMLSMYICEREDAGYFLGEKIVVNAADIERAYYTFSFSYKCKKNNFLRDHVFSVDAENEADAMLDLKRHNKKYKEELLEITSTAKKLSHISVKGHENFITVDMIEAIEKEVRS